MMMISRLAFVGLASVACLTTGTAVAQMKCTDETKTWDAGLSEQAAIRTVVKNETSSKVFEVTIYRNGSKKQNKFISSGQEFAYRMGVGNVQEERDIAVTLYIQRRDASHADQNCAYNVDYKNVVGGTYSAKWYLPDGNGSICSDVTELCADCELTCSKSWNPGGSNAVWRTVLTISD